MSTHETGKKYSCLMHEDIISDKLGKCSKCGMDLVEEGDGQSDMDHSQHDGEQASHDHHNHTEHHRMMMEDFKRRFWVTLPLVIATLILSPQIQEWFGYSLDFLYKDIILFIHGWYGLLIIGLKIKQKRNLSRYSDALTAYSR